MVPPEFSRPFSVDTIGTQVRIVEIAATPVECAALAARFGLVSVSRLEATGKLFAEGKAIIASGQLSADAVQSCIASAADVPVKIREPYLIRFVAALADDATPDEVELGEADCDTVEHDGHDVDLGEAVAQSFGLALDPFPRAPDAAAILKAAGVLSEDEVQVGPFAGLKGLLGNSEKAS
jgi:uncharacterized metal-binding protein YceD (DUF177 family)